MVLHNNPVRLNVRRPSPTTTQYTVSNSRRHHYPLSKISHFLGLLVRLLLAVTLVVVFFSLCREVVNSLGDGTQHASSYTGPLHEWAREYNIPNGKPATWISMAAIGLTIWLLGKRTVFGKLHLRIIRYLN